MIRRWLALLAVPAAILAMATPSMASPAAPAASGGTKIIIANTIFGRALAIGSGPFKNYTAYSITSDHGRSFGCTTTPVSTQFGSLTCAGLTLKDSEWPAVTTSGQPVAGPGVSQALLGRVYRPGIGDQVTYAGHPLYLFDYTPGGVSGEGWFEPGQPPWHGMWYLLSARGEPVPWTGTLATTYVDKGKKRVLAESYLTLNGWVNFPVYTFNGDRVHFANCSGRPNCARAWLPVLTSSAPGRDGVPAAGVGELGIPGGLRQVTWHGHPLYLFSREELKQLSHGIASAGNGDGVHAFGGTFRLVVNP